MGLLGVVVAAACALAASAIASPPPQSSTRPGFNLLHGRALPDAPDGYTPASVDCPKDRPAIRAGTALSPAEQDWLPVRRNATIPAIRDFLSRAAIPDFDSNAYFADVETTDPTRLPNIAIAVSGGGYRAMTAGAGALAAFDSRTTGSTAKGHLGGLLQSATYLAGLSGGGWLVGSLALNNFTTVQDIQARNRIWQLGQSIFEGPDDGPSLVSYWDAVLKAVAGKGAAGYNRTITDYWGRTLSYQLIEPGAGGVSFTFSSIAEDPTLTGGGAPLPILVADGRYPGETIISSNTTVYELNPWEMGSWDPTLRAFAPMRYVGSAFDNGSLPENATCVRGFDNAGFVMGTSSSLFNQIALYLAPDSTLRPAGVPGFVVTALVDLFNDLGKEQGDIAEWSPNPFFGYAAGNNLNVAQRSLTLVDGGEDLQNVPYYPLIQDDRAVDVIFSYDSSADTVSNWPDGASAMATYRRSLDPIAGRSSFPSVPDTNTFVNAGLNTRPTFFGCDAKNATRPGAHAPAPLIVYIPSYPYVFMANLSTFTTISMSNPERNAMIRNGYETATMANSTRDADWQVCAACAVMSRSWARTGTAVPAKCGECFDRFCWDGTVNSSTPPPYEPKLFGTAVDTEDSGAAGKVAGTAGMLLAAVAAGFVLAV